MKQSAATKSHLLTLRSARIHTAMIIRNAAIPGAIMRMMKNQKRAKIARKGKMTRF